MFRDAERERFVVEIPQAKAEIEVPLSFVNSWMVDGGISPGTSYPTKHAPATHLSRSRYDGVPELNEMSQVIELF